MSPANCLATPANGQSLSNPSPQPRDLDALNRRLEGASAAARIAFALEYCGQGLVMSSSFGAQSAVLLHLATRLWPAIPVILIDTGYLFPETYGFVDQLTAHLDLELHVYRAALSPAWQEARFGKLWEQGVEGIERYNRLNKVEPMVRALDELQATGWLAGLRRHQARSRRQLPVVGCQWGRLKVLPLVDWTPRDCHRYLQEHDLPYHPLWHRGYASIGDVHTTRPLGAELEEEHTRFFGLVRECGLHGADAANADVNPRPTPGQPPRPTP